MALSPEQIFEVANALHAEGERVSTVNVYRKLGRGSLTTIGKYLKEWRPLGPEAPALTPEMPQEIEDAFQRFSLDVWRRISAVTKGRVEAVKQEAQGEAQRLQTEFEEASQILDSLQETNEKMKVDFDAERSRFESERSHLQEELQRIREEFSVTTKLHAEATARIEALDEELSEARDRRREAEAERATLRERVEQLEKQLRDCGAERADLSFRITEVIGEREAAKAETQALQREADRLRAEIQGMKDFAREMQEKASIEAQRAAALQGEITALRALLPKQKKGE
jgi:chromosome segregation ATPase